jgi:hypothetical protein
MRVQVPKLQRNFAGLDGFIWAVGVVEDRIDPLLLGRCKVRYFGWHTEDKKEIPTEDLPWSHPLLPLDSGRHVVGPKEGDWVMGFFRDGIVAQEPVMIGVWPGITEIEANPEIGFNDPRPDSVLNPFIVPRDPLSFPMQTDTGAGSFLDELPSPISRYPQNEPGDPLLRYVDNKESTANRFERNEFIDQTIVEAKRFNVGIGQAGVPTAMHPDAGVGSDTVSFSMPWTEAATPYAAKYPYNHAYFSESGHLVEIDDSPGAQRLHWYHRSGTFREIHPMGEQVEKIVMNEYHICLKNRYTHIEASDNETVDWNKNIFINKDRKHYNYDVTVGSGGNWNETLEKGNLNRFLMEGDENTRINGFRYYRIEKDEIGHILKDRCVTIDADDVLHVKGNGNILIWGNQNVRICGNSTLTISGDANIKVYGKAKTVCMSHMITEVYGDKVDKIHGNYYLDVMKNQRNTVWEDCNQEIHGNRTVYTYKTNNEYVAGKEFIGIGDDRQINVEKSNHVHALLWNHMTAGMVIDIKGMFDVRVNDIWPVLDPQMPCPPPLNLIFQLNIPTIPLLETVKINPVLEAFLYKFKMPEM